MKKRWLALIVLTGLFLFGEHFLSDIINFHSAFRLMVLFFAAQAFVLFRLDHWASKEWEIQMSMIKIIIRLLSSLVFILVLIYTEEDQLNLVVQFIALYLVYMIFEIVEALTNLRQN